MHLTTRTSTVALTLALLLVALLAIDSTPSYAASTSTSRTGTVDANLEAEFVRLLNGERSSRGLRTLGVAPDLTTLARSHSQEMISQNRLHHNPNLGGDVQNWRVVAENVGTGHSASSLHRAFMDSTGHRANILNERVDQVGVGVQVIDGRIWVTKIFRLRADTSKTPSASTTAASTTSSSSRWRLGNSPAALPSGKVTTPLAGDWDGNGSVTPGWYIDGEFRLSNYHDGSGPLHAFRYGSAGDLPLVGDWDGNGTDTVGIVRDGTWHLINHHRGGNSQISFVYGRVTRGDIPMAGDWDGNGTDTPAIVRDGEWHFMNRHRGGNSEFSFVYGRVTRGDIPFVGDWDNDGVDTAGIIRDGEWHLVNRHRGGNSDVMFIYGRVTRGDIPVVGDWDGDGDTNVSIIRGDDWHYRRTNSGGNAELSRTWAP